MFFEIFINVMAGFIGSAITVAAAAAIYLARKGQFTGWAVVVRKGDKVLCKRPVGRKKAEEVLDDATSLSVFIKGVVSPFCWLNEDVLSEKASKKGLFQVSFPGRTWTVDILKNPATPPKK